MWHTNCNSSNYAGISIAGWYPALFIHLHEWTVQDIDGICTGWFVWLLHNWHNSYFIIDIKVMWNPACCCMSRIQAPSQMNATQLKRYVNVYHHNNFLRVFVFRVYEALWKITHWLPTAFKVSTCILIAFSILQFYQTHNYLQDHVLCLTV